MRKIKFNITAILFLFLFFFVFIYNFYSFSDDSKTEFYCGDNMNIRFVGCFDFNEKHKAKTGDPGAYFEFETFGKYCDIILEDECKFGSNHNYIEIVIDDTIMKRIKLTEKVNTLTIFKELSASKHHVLICKNTEKEVGFIQLVGIKCEKLLPKPKSKNYCFEFIGDSITCGNGADSSQLSFGKGAWYDYHNAYLSYGPLLARYCQADWILNSVSGIGMNRSCCGMSHTMPEIYFNNGFQRNSKVKSTKNQRQPDIVFITLGQNDDRYKMEAYEKAYISFLTKLRKTYPRSLIICCTSPMANRDYQEKLCESISNVLDIQAKSGDYQIKLFCFEKTYNSGYDQHPTISQHHEMFEELAAYMKENKFILK